MNRRNFLQCSLGLGALSMLPSKMLHAYTEERHIALYNVHTGENLSCCYFANGQYEKGSIKDLNQILRDFRANQPTSMDPKLYDILYTLHTDLGSKEPFHIISGYRSPKTNEKLRKMGRKVAKRSYHLKGKAIDIFLPDVPLKKLHRAALKLKAGGVGYYPHSNFVHIDTGPVRSW